jgi:hypothetical protein
VIVRGVTGGGCVLCTCAERGGWVAILAVDVSLAVGGNLGFAVSRRPLPFAHFRSRTAAKTI